MNTTGNSRQSLIVYVFFLMTFICSASLAYADILPKARVYYAVDGSVSIEYFMDNACIDGETETACMNRISIKTGHEGIPFDDIDPRTDLPSDRSTRDTWRGQKGKGVWADRTLVTRKDKVLEYRELLDRELDTDKPDPSKVLKLQRMIEKVQDIDHRILSMKDVESVERKLNKGFFAAAISAVGDAVSSVFNGIKQGFLALASLVTDKLQVGTSEAPSGITIYDVKTKKPYCMVMSNGKMENIPGECGAPVPDPAPPVEPPPPPPDPQITVAPPEPENTVTVQPPLEEPPPQNTTVDMPPEPVPISVPLEEPQTIDRDTKLPAEQASTSPADIGSIPDTAWPVPDPP